MTVYQTYKEGNESIVTGRCFDKCLTSGSFMRLVIKYNHVISCQFIRMLRIMFLFNYMYIAFEKKIIDKILHLKKTKTLTYYIICSTAFGKSLLKI